MQTDLELGQMNRRRNMDKENGNSTFPSAQRTASNQKAINNLEESATYFELYLKPGSYREKGYEAGYGRGRPGRKYKSSGTFRHKDSIGRVWIGPEDDRYLSATDGRLERLVVQASWQVRSGSANSTWARKPMEERIPAILRIVYGLLGPHLESDREASWGTVCIGWIPSCLMIAALLFIPTNLGGEKRNFGRYEKFKYHYWGYSKVPANPKEIPESRASTLSDPHRMANELSERLLHPRTLCLLDEDSWIPIDVNEYEAVHGSLEYLFVCYTAEQFSENEDMDELHRIAEAAARRAGVAAYWISCTCMPEEQDHCEDVYRISDVVRGAHSLVVIIGPSRGSSSSERDMIRQLGSRMWTFPEVLLSRSSRPISIYMRDCDPGSFRTLSKRDFAIEAWGDAVVSRQLIDHYEASIILSPLELVSLALQCFPGRETGKHYDGDLSYALMGLLRRRPRVNKDDSAFEAFCRLSLANDSNQLIERLICILPPEVNTPWHEVKDFWGSNLWDIEPHCQVVGLGGNDTVILSGAFGAPIRWKSFVQANISMRNTLKRSVARVVLRSSPVWVFPGVLFLAISQSKGGFPLVLITTFGWIFIGLYALVIFTSPYLIYSLYVGKTWAVQPWLFGFEGYVEIDEIERLIFGINLGRLKWSPYSSHLSWHEDKDGECVGQDPVRNETFRRIVSEARNSQYGDPKVFTLVDTNTLTVTLFKAVRPPVAMLLCGTEGGMQRALLCSYDWKTQTLYRESVLRVDTVVLEHMSRVDRFRLGLHREIAETEMIDY
ncbi:hypothetical protein Plec18167_004514 [Paecilomyces lecythidis]|uniref:Uncharacterized protein n=1 Tax=Paecilomyces lecythidis TaxID=3004212 RepID=A0ABR3XSE0_9EURO